MCLPKLKTKISVEDYLETEKISPVRREYVEGEVYAMAGASDNYERVTINLTIALSIHLRNSKCEPFAGNTKVQVTKTSIIIPTCWFRAKKTPKILIFAMPRF